MCCPKKEEKKENKVNESFNLCYKYYIGETSKETFTVSDLTKSTQTKLTSLTANKSTGDTVTVWVYPSSWGRPTSMKSTATNAEMVQSWTFNDTWMTVPSGYTGAWIQVSGTSSWNITW